MRRGEPTGAQQQEHGRDDPRRHAVDEPATAGRRPIMDHPTRKNQPGQHKPHVTEKTKHHIGDPGADHATQIGHGSANTGR